MSITRLKSKSKTPRKSFFTMVELIAVISITAILLTITIKIMKTDSTKANAQVIGSALSYAQAYALANLSEDDNSPADGFADEYIMVSIDSTNGLISTYKYDTSNNSVKELISEESLTSGSTITDANGNNTDFLIGFRSKGDPIYVSSVSLPVTLPLTISTLISQSNSTIYVTDNNNPEQQQSIKVKPFTGKITYY